MRRMLAITAVWLTSVVCEGETGLEALEQNIADQVNAAHGAGEFAGCVVAIGNSEAILYQQAFGDRQVVPTTAPMMLDTVFDLASLTKPVATATSIMRLVEQGHVRLTDPISRHLPEITGDHGKAITLRLLLTHYAGYVPDNPLADYQQGPDEAWRRLFRLRPTKPPGTTFQYSDVNFELLGKVVERVSGEPLDEFARDELYAPLGMTRTTFNPGPELTGIAAATEPRDGQMLVGEVHDPRAALLGGVAGHAGLFSTAGDLAKYAMVLLRNDGSLLSPATVAEMTRPLGVEPNLRTQGWDHASRYSSNRGDLLSDRAFGHGGFTGTAMWIDPELGLFVIFLSNRLHPDGSGSVNDLAGRIANIAAAATSKPAP
ncbi:MAG: serine hydrolase domain-containing protein [Planctomycetota bacterium]